MILVDTSIWVDHLRDGDEHLTELLNRGLVLMHRHVIGEIACGSLRDRSIVSLLGDLPVSVVADDDEVLRFIDRFALHGKGIGYVNVHLLASVMLTGNATLWTRDRRLHIAAQELAIGHRDTPAH